MLTSPKNMAQNEFIELNVDPNGYSTVAISTAPTTAANATFVVQVEGTTGDFITIKVYDDIAGAAAAGVTGPSKYAHVDIPGTKKVRMTRTDANGGVGLGAMSVVKSAGVP